MHSFDLTPDERQALWQWLLPRLEDYYAHTRTRPTTPPLDVEQIRNYLHHSFEEVLPATDALRHVLDGLETHHVHTPHPRYFGLYNPRANFAAILADTIVAVFNPQLAAWSHAPFANEAERSVIHYFAGKFGYAAEQADGVFTSGGAEANQTGVLLALHHQFPAYAQEGLQALEARPTLYCSQESHHSLMKAARTCGLGSRAVRLVPLDADYRLDTTQLERMILEDRAQGFFPFMVVATVGTTGAGIIDPLHEIAALAQRHGLWLHADAAYGGALCLSPAHQSLLDGIEKADSITFDAHKWLSVSMAAGMILTRHPHLLSQTFGIATDYMPKEASHLTVVDPFTHSLQWSRRFIGLKVYLSLLMFGESGYAATLAHQIRMGAVLRQGLRDRGWHVYNPTELPVICFGRKDFAHDLEAARRLVGQVVAAGKSWLSVYTLNGQPTLRACITNYATTEEDVRGLLEELEAYVAEKA
ncbi:Glutamate or tyrosine decarboxylase [Catalinimonas alkaloidigena]|uniref:Glutamate or tyrosine decarboxylase n=1 Tax=Catalinimonas alkaloidigena TaxID=1075417 RepID=A0A1G8X6C0_9BACT|nr:aminotransferase class I/II-fold pyridoxal phosphate-dependent enzyme [Catalinimonas alkaloidigena]SDJ85300.1 Glutamate or tyrosine decarboxylase [Catalinimonas alkaloidigena]